MSAPSPEYPCPSGGRTRVCCFVYIVYYGQLEHFVVCPVVVVVDFLYVEHDLQLLHGGPVEKIVQFVLYRI